VQRSPPLLVPRFRASFPCLVLVLVLEKSHRFSPPACSMTRTSTISLSTSTSTIWGERTRAGATGIAGCFRRTLASATREGSFPHEKVFPVPRSSFPCLVPVPRSRARSRARASCSCSCSFPVPRSSCLVLRAQLRNLIHRPVFLVGNTACEGCQTAVISGLIRRPGRRRCVLSPSLQACPGCGVRVHSWFKNRSLGCGKNPRRVGWSRFFEPQGSCFSELYRLLTD